MIKELSVMTEDELDTIMAIWFDANSEAHPFVPKEYWLDHLDEVRELLPQATIYIYQEDDEISGFMGIMGDYIAGIFVKNTKRGKKIGQKLLDEAKKTNQTLSLNVYQKNEGAYRFYLREGFIVSETTIEVDNQEKEYKMRWIK